MENQETYSRIESKSQARVLLSVDEAAMALSMGRTFVYHLLMRGELASIKVGRRRRIPVSALHDFVSRQLTAVERGA